MKQDAVPAPELPRRLWYLGLMAVLVGGFFLQTRAASRAASQTWDEANHLAAGASYLATRDFRMAPENPPLSKMLAALPSLFWGPRFVPREPSWMAINPWTSGNAFLYAPGVDSDAVLRRARIPIRLLGCLLLCCVMAWAWQLWGPGGALVSGAFAAFDPTLIAHSSVVTPDVAVALFGFAACWIAWQLHRASRAWLWPALGMALGLAVSSKFTALLVVPALFASWIWTFLRAGNGSMPKRSAAEGLAVAAACGLAVLWACYLFQSPMPFLKGLLWQANHQREGHAAFLLGSVSTHGRLSYFPIVLLVRTPLATLAAFAAGMLQWGRGPLRRWPAAPFWGAAFVLFPAAAHATLMVFGNVNLGARYLLPMFPFLFVLAGRLATVRLPKAALLSLALPMITAASVLAQAPRPLSYFNAIAGGPKGGARWLGDSNLDWGQDLRALGDSIRRRGGPLVYLAYNGTAPPEYYGIRNMRLQPGACEPDPGEAPALIAASISCLQGTPSWPDVDRLAFLRSREPIEQVGVSIRLFAVERADHAKLAALFGTGCAAQRERHLANLVELGQ